MLGNPAPDVVNRNEQWHSYCIWIQYCSRLYRPFMFGSTVYVTICRTCSGAEGRDQSEWSYYSASVRLWCMFYVNALVRFRWSLSFFALLGEVEGSGISSKLHGFTKVALHIHRLFLGFQGERRARDLPCCLPAMAYTSTGNLIKGTQPTCPYNVKIISNIGSVLTVAATRFH